MGHATTFNPNMFGSWGDRFNNWRQDSKKYAIRALVLLIALLVFVLFPINVFKEALQTPPPAKAPAIDPAEMQRLLPWLNLSFRDCPSPLRECAGPLRTNNNYHGG